MLRLTLVEKVGEPGVSSEKEVVWQKYLTSEGEKVAFWGEFGADNLNLKKLKGHFLPVTIYLPESEFCHASAREKKMYDIDWSVPEICDLYFDGHLPNALCWARLL